MGRVRTGATGGSQGQQIVGCGADRVHLSPSMLNMSWRPFCESSPQGWCRTDHAAAAFGLRVAVWPGGDRRAAHHLGSKFASTIETFTLASEAKSSPTFAGGRSNRRGGEKRADHGFAKRGTEKRRDIRGVQCLTLGAKTTYRSASRTSGRRDACRAFHMKRRWVRIV